MSMSPEEIDHLWTTLGQEIAELRAQFELRQTDLAEQAGVSRASIANLEAGRQYVPLHVLIQIAAAFGLGLEDLLDPTLAYRRRYEPRPPRP